MIARSWARRPAQERCGTCSTRPSILLGHQLDRHEQLGQGEQLGDCLLVAAAVLFQGLAGDFHLIGDAP
jgi:hypothetical protein